MSKKILFVVEGFREHEELKRNLLSHINLKLEECELYIYGTSIHELSLLLEKEENIGLSLTAVLIKNNLVDANPNIQLDSTFSSIYLIFDFDPQYHRYSKEELTKVTSRFNNETEEGKLLLNYPMFESLFDIDDLNNRESYLLKKVKVLTSDEYKKEVKKTTCLRSLKGNVYKHIDSKETFVEIANLNLLKYKNIVKNNDYDGCDEEKLLEIQVDMLENTKEFYVINTMCLLYFDYN